MIKLIDFPSASDIAQFMCYVIVNRFPPLFQMVSVVNVDQSPSKRLKRQQMANAFAERSDH